MIGYIEAFLATNLLRIRFEPSRNSTRREFRDSFPFRRFRSENSTRAEVTIGRRKNSYRCTRDKYFNREDEAIVIETSIQGSMQIVHNLFLHLSMC